MANSPKEPHSTMSVQPSYSFFSQKSLSTTSLKYSWSKLLITNVDALITHINALITNVNASITNLNASIANVNDIHVKLTLK